MTGSFIKVIMVSIHTLIYIEHTQFIRTKYKNYTEIIMPIVFAIERAPTPGHGEQDLSDWTVPPVDTDNLIITPDQITLNGVDRNEDVLFYKEYPDWIGTFEFQADVQLNPGTIAGGMIPKIECCLKALDMGVGEISSEL